MRIVLLFIIAFGFALSGQAQTPYSVKRSLGVTKGVLMNTDSGGQVWIGAGDFDPSIFPGVNAPLGSMFRQTNGDVWIKTGALDTDWDLDGLGSAVFTQTASFGSTGNTAAGAFINRAGNVPSNKSGEITLVGTGQIRSVGCSQEDTDTWSMEVYEHDGQNFPTGFTLLYTLNVVASNSYSVHNQTISVTRDKQLAIRSLNAVKNVGCTIVMKGLSL